MRNRFPAGRHVAAVLIALVAVLFLRSWLQLYLLGDVAPPPVAADLAYLLVTPVLALLLLPVLLEDRSELGRRLGIPGVRTLLVALAVGLLLRLMWWLHVIAGVALGLYRAEAGEPATPLQMQFACPSPGTTVLALIVTAMLMPCIEELIHRGYVLSALRRRGAIVAISVSAALFALLHPPGSWFFAFAAGVVFGIQYWRSGSLWPSMISHATVNALIVFDWRCLQGRWIPAETELPLWYSGLVSTAALVVCCAVMAVLLKRHGDRGA